MENVDIQEGGILSRALEIPRGGSDWWVGG